MGERRIDHASKILLQREWSQIPQTRTAEGWHQIILDNPVVTVLSSLRHQWQHRASVGFHIVCKTRCRTDCDEPLVKRPQKLSRDFLHFPPRHCGRCEFGSLAFTDALPTDKLILPVEQPPEVTLT